MKTAPKNPRLLAFVGHNDADILPFFLAHYRKLGVSGFLLALHGPWPETTLDGLTREEDVAIWDLLGDVYEDSYRRSILNLMADGERDRWVVVVDVDEFLELPFGTMKRTIAGLEVVGEAAMPAFLLQRISKDGGLPVLDPSSPIDRQMPNGHFNLCEEMQTEKSVWKTKYPLSKVVPGFKIDRGNHWPPVAGAQAHLPIRGVLHHFKWRSALKTAFDLARGPSSNHDEMESYRRWLAAHDDRLPTKQARPVSRQDLFARGLLVKPDRRQLLHATLRRRSTKKGASGESRHERLSLQLNALASLSSDPSRQRSDKARETPLSITDPSHLLLPPGRICLVTFDLTPPLTSGGIGTAMAALAEQLSAAGHDVHLLFCPYDGPSDLWQLWYDYWKNRGVTLHHLPRIDGEERRYLAQGPFLSKITRFLQDYQFDVVHIADAAGYGQFFAILRAAGLASSRTRIVVTAHGGTAWHHRGNHLPWTKDEADATFAEEQMLRLADVVCCPSRHMRDQLLQSGLVSSEHLIVLPNNLANLSRSYSENDRPVRAVKEFVMIGRIEPRKGMERFAEAIRRLQDAGRFEFDVTFLGTAGPGIEIDDVRAMLGAKGETARFIDHFDPLETINYLRTHDCLVVAPSLRENLPYAVYECLENGIPLLASNVGGIPELIEEGALDRILVAADPEKLAKAMADALTAGAKPANLAFDPSEVALKHLALHAKLVDEAKRPARGLDHTITDPSRPSVTALIYGKAELGEEAEARRRDALPDPISCIPAGEQVESDAWAIEANATAEASGADWLVLCHAMAVPERKALTAMASVLQTGQADAVVTSYRVAFVDGAKAGPDDTLLAPGGPPVFAPSWNLFGIGLVLISRARFVELGGFCAEGVPDRWAHWELLNRLVAEGGEIIGIPQALVTGYCRSADELSSMQTPSFAEALLTPWLKRTPSHLQAFLRQAAGEGFGQCPETRRAEEWLRGLVRQSN